MRTIEIVIQTKGPKALEVCTTGRAVNITAGRVPLRYLPGHVTTTGPAFPPLCGYHTLRKPDSHVTIINSECPIPHHTTLVEVKDMHSLQSFA